MEYTICCHENADITEHNRAHDGLSPKNRSSCNVRLWIDKGGLLTVKRAFTPEQIINKLREAKRRVAQPGDIYYIN
ncbi:hypothetical protein ACFLUK_00620 [Chloroflexota bacterium]